MRTVTRVALFLLFAAVLMFAQIGASITGTVTDQAGAVVPNVNIDVIRLDTNAVFSVGTSATGTFIVLVPPGKYELSIAQPGFKQICQKGLEVPQGATLRADVKLIPKQQQIVPPILEIPRLQVESRQVHACVNDVDTPPQKREAATL